MYFGVDLSGFNFFETCFVPFLRLGVLLVIISSNVICHSLSLSLSLLLLGHLQHAKGLDFSQKYLKQSSCIFNFFFFLFSLSDSYYFVSQCWGGSPPWSQTVGTPERMEIWHPRQISTLYLSAHSHREETGEGRWWDASLPTSPVLSSLAPTQTRIFHSAQQKFYRSQTQPPEKVLRHLLI